MKINLTGSLTATPSRRVDKRKDKSSEKFGDHVAVEEMPETRSIASVKGVTSVDSLLAAQEVDNPADRPAKARQRAEDILDRLDRVRHGLLAGAFSRGDLEGLARLVRIEKLEVNDAKLTEILAQIELRAEIELAKYSTLDLITSR